VDEAADFNRFAFKALPVLGKEGLSISAHLGEQDEVFKRAFAIYAEAFSGLERRSLCEQRDVMRRPHYRFSAVLREGEPVGVLAWWKLSGFCFVEHFAIAEAHRSGGLGRRAVELLLGHVAEPVAVDVEPFGTGHAAARRVAFYRRLGFAYCGQPVTLPAYRGKGSAPSNFMVWGAEPDRGERERIFETICSEIYSLDASVPYADRA
jgi:GNAT superfamily N-acetyltransferase